VKQATHEYRCHRALKAVVVKVFVPTDGATACAKRRPKNRPNLRRVPGTKEKNAAVPYREQLSEAQATKPVVAPHFGRTKLAKVENDRRR
jgi:hypothetical protein